MEGEGQAVLLQGEAGIGNPLAADASHAASRNARTESSFMVLHSIRPARFGR